MQALWQHLQALQQASDKPANINFDYDVGLHWLLYELHPSLYLRLRRSRVTISQTSRRAIVVVALVHNSGCCYAITCSLAVPRQKTIAATQGGGWACAEMSHYFSG